MENAPALSPSSYLLAKRTSTLARLLGVAAASLFAACVAVATEAEDAVKKADADRVAATFAHDATKLGALLSDNLVYGVTDGGGLNKARYLASVGTSPAKYTSNKYEDLVVSEVAPTVVVMSGRARVGTFQDGKPLDIAFRMLAVWRKENGAWKLFAYQSSRLPDPVK